MRKNLTTKEAQQKDNLEELIIAYAENKAILDDYKKLCDRQNKEIKKYMEASNIIMKRAGKYIANYSVSKRETLNEEQLLATLNKDWPLYCEQEGIIKTKEYIDFDVLENLLYNENVPEELMLEIQNCKECKNVVTLRITSEDEEKK